MPSAAVVMKTAVPGTRVALAAADLMKIAAGIAASFIRLIISLPAPRPGGEQGEGDEADQQREPAAVGHLGQIRAEIGDVDEEEERRAPGSPARASTSTATNSTTVSRQVSMNIAPVTAMP